MGLAPKIINSGDPLEQDPTHRIWDRGLRNPSHQKYYKHNEKWGRDHQSYASDLGPKNSWKSGAIDHQSYASAFDREPRNPTHQKAYRFCAKELMDATICVSAFSPFWMLRARFFDDVFLTTKWVL